jgi:hypothetical protein
MRSSTAWMGLAFAVCGALGMGACGDDDEPASNADGAPRGGGASGSADAQMPGGGTARGGTFRAVIDGTPWEATMNVRTRIDEDVPGGYRLEGTSDSLQHLELDLFYVGAPGSSDIGVTASVVGASGSYSRGSSVWQAPASGDAGTLEVTTLSNKRITGTFELAVAPVPGSQAKGEVQITEGEFDLPLAGSAIEIGANVGSTVSADFAGERFNAASVVITPYAKGISFNALNDAYNLGFVLDQVDGPGSYALSTEPPARSAVVVAGSKRDDANCCWVSGPDSEGSVTFITFDADRMIGSFELTLGAMAGSPASAPLVVTAGEFDIGRGKP